MENPFLLNKRMIQIDEGIRECKNRLNSVKASIIEEFHENPLNHKVKIVVYPFEEKISIKLIDQTYEGIDSTITWKIRKEQRREKTEQLVYRYLRIKAEIRNLGTL